MECTASNTCGVIWLPDSTALHMYSKKLYDSEHGIMCHSLHAEWPSDGLVHSHSFYVQWTHSVIALDRRVVFCGSYVTLSRNDCQENPCRSGAFYHTAKNSYHFQAIVFCCLIGGYTVLYSHVLIFPHAVTELQQQTVVLSSTFFFFRECAR